MWRLTMKPKPTYEWVVRELEKAGVREIKTPKGMGSPGHELRGEHDMEGVGEHAAVHRLSHGQVQFEDLSERARAALLSSARSPGGLLSGAGSALGGRQAVDLREVLAMQDAKERRLAAHQAGLGGLGGAAADGSAGSLGRAGLGRFANDVLSAELGTLPRNP